MVEVVATTHVSPEWFWEYGYLSQQYSSAQPYHDTSAEPVLVTSVHLREPEVVQSGNSVVPQAQHKRRRSFLREVAVEYPLHPSSYASGACPNLCCVQEFWVVQPEQQVAALPENRCGSPRVAGREP